MGITLASQVSVRPYLWDPKGAFDFPGLWATVEEYRSPDSPLPTSMFMVICFEETGCCNILQVPPAGMGPGQLQVSESNCVRFFADPGNMLGMRYDSSQTLKGVRPDNSIYDQKTPLHKGLPPLDRQFVLDHNDFSVKMHIKCMEWFRLGRSDGKPKGLDGLLSMQTGNQIKAINAFKNGNAALVSVMQSAPPPPPFNADQKTRQDYIDKRRKAYADALNVAKSEFRGKDAIIPLSRYPGYWEFLLPDDFLLPTPGGYIPKSI